MGNKAWPEDVTSFYLAISASDIHPDGVSPVGQTKATVRGIHDTCTCTDTPTAISISVYIHTHMNMDVNVYVYNFHF